MAGAPRKPTKPTPLTAMERARQRYESERAEFAPGVINRAKLAIKHGEGEYKTVTSGKRKQLMDAMDERYKRSSAYAEMADTMKEAGVKNLAGDKLAVKKAMGGKLKMVEKGGKKVPAFAADGVGKMAKGGKAAKMTKGSKK